MKKQEHKDPVHFPKVALVYENKFKKEYELMLKNTNMQVIQKLKNFLKEKVV